MEKGCDAEVESAGFGGEVVVDVVVERMRMSRVEE